MYQYISIGGWCGTRIALDQLKITDEPHNIFDHIRSSSKGIIDCIKTDFASFLPENKVVDTRFKNYKPFIGEHFGFYHSGNLTDKSVLDSFDRKIKRFIEYCNSEKKCIFIRTCTIPDYESELNDMKTLYEVIRNKYPKLSFIIVFIIPDQEITTYYNNIGDKIYIFCLNDKSYNNNNLGGEYKNIFKFISDNNLFEIIPPQNENIQLIPPTSRLCLVDNIHAVKYFEKYYTAGHLKQPPPPSPPPPASRALCRVGVARDEAASLI